jgi:hypothetical protein
MFDPSRILQRCDALARHSELPGGLTRVFLDAIGNAVGRYEGERPDQEHKVANVTGDAALAVYRKA